MSPTLEAYTVATNSVVNDVHLAPPGVSEVVLGVITPPGVSGVALGLCLVCVAAFSGSLHFRSSPAWY